jgi:hypothetical protein
MFRQFAPAFLVLLAGGCSSETAVEPGRSPYNVDAAGVALRGYSPVSYLDERKAERGVAEHRVVWRGVGYLMTNAVQAEAFREDPARYEPACGGWCAYGMSLGIRWDPDPTNFEIIGGRTYLFSRGAEADARALWNREPDHDARLARVDHYWRSIQD